MCVKPLESNSFFAAPSGRRVCENLSGHTERFDCVEGVAGGSPTDLIGDATARVKLRADIWPDQPDVPAVSTTHFLLGPVLTTTRSPAFALVLSSADKCSPLEFLSTSSSS